ncbi:hypothetical protein BLNAU_636 [Blattamonas nauphoetae]|uniref:Uncharacterized protein n=1 Tax=Blattamonas nauphoetae TaxID=2049346 RepID=A0ABQ9YK21_9EUKA|nr:hypothetical protein BLNAU_636 [Blattamonas nauphoetae]
MTNPRTYLSDLITNPSARHLADILRDERSRSTDCDYHRSLSCYDFDDFDFDPHPLSQNRLNQAQDWIIVTPEELDEFEIIPTDGKDVIVMSSLGKLYSVEPLYSSDLSQENDYCDFSEPQSIATSPMYGRPLCFNDLELFYPHERDYRRSSISPPPSERGFQAYRSNPPSTRQSRNMGQNSDLYDELDTMHNFLRSCKTY